MDKPEFDPSKPFEASKPAFDPSQAFQSSMPQAQSKPEEPSLREKLSNALMKTPSFAGLGLAINSAVGDAAVRALDYGGGLARTAIAGATGVANKDDLYNALQGRAPRSSDYLERGGVPDGPKIPLTNISARDVAGVTADVATDPLAYVAPLNRFMGVGQIAKESGEAAYRAGLKRIDEETAKYGKEPVSKLLMDNRVTGSAKSIASQMNDMAADRLAQRNAILSEADKTGLKADVPASLSKAQGYIDNLTAQNDPRLEPLISKMQDEVDLLSTAQNVSPSQMSQLKTNTYNTIGDAAYNEAKKTPAWKQFQKAVASGQKDAAEAAVGNSLGDDLAARLAQKNDELGRLLTSQEKADLVANIENRKNNFTSVDGMILGNALSGESSGSHGGWPMLLLKKVADAAKATGPRTVGGLALQDLGQTGIPDAVARRILIDQTNPWVSRSNR